MDELIIKILIDNKEPNIKFCAITLINKYVLYINVKCVFVCDNSQVKNGILFYFT